METPMLLINGKLVAADQIMRVINPATEEVLADCPRVSRNQFDAAVTAAKAAFPKWSKTDIGERRKLIGQIADVIDATASSLARTQESPSAPRSRRHSTRCTRGWPAEPGHDDGLGPTSPRFLTAPKASP